MSRVYFHIDLNAFFANAEILLDPSLKGKPIAVSGTTRRSVVSTASYEARKYGVHSAMPISEAKQLCKDLIVVEPHYHWYEELSTLFIQIISSYTTEIEQASIDECYADMTEAIQRFPKPLDLAWQIQQRLLKEIKIPCSIGVGPNMFLAKMASDMKKPLGITVIRYREVQEKLWPLPIKDLRGVGEKTSPILEEMGILTIGDLANYPSIEELRPIFGKNTEFMVARAKEGFDDRTITKDWDAKSMGVSETFLEDITDYEEIRGCIRSLSRTLSKRLKEAKKVGFSIAIRIRSYDFTNIDRSKRLEYPIWSAQDLYVHAIDLFEEYWDNEAIRLIGISLSDFRNEEEYVEQISLFDEEKEMKRETSAVIKELNQLIGEKVFIRASDTEGKK